MPSLVDCLSGRPPDRLSGRSAGYLSRLRWMAIPIAAYLMITLVLPMARGAVARDNFVHHAGWVAAGCAVVVVLSLICTLVADAARAAVQQLRGRGGRS
jgi:hypothetical protein